MFSSYLRPKAYLEHDNYPAQNWKKWTILFKALNLRCGSSGINLCRLLKLRRRTSLMNLQP
jgi:hypothetical protein